MGYKGCNTEAVNLQGWTGWEAAIQCGHLGLYDTLTALAQARVVTLDGATEMLRYPALSNEFRVQRMRRQECQDNQDPWLRMFNRARTARLAAIPLWQLLLRAHFAVKQTLQDYRIAQRAAAEEAVAEAEAEQEAKIREKQRAVQGSLRVPSHVAQTRIALQVSAADAREGVEATRQQIANLPEGASKEAAMGRLRVLE